MTEANTTPSQTADDHRDPGTIARDGDATARRALASDSDTRPEILYYLAEDPDAEVRRCIAENEQTPRQADILLAHDDSEEVRCVLARKIGRLFPETSATERSVLRRAVLDITEILATDQTNRVRELVSEAIKDLPDVPLHLVRQLANDPYLTVCGPVLEYSPVLTESDLLEIIESSPVQGALGAISRRTAVGESISHAIASSDDTDAITDLLANPSAQIREETLDSLVAGASAIPAWHAPLVKRPALPVNAAQRIAGFVADSLLDTLRKRADLDEAVIDAIETAVTKRLASDQRKEAEGAEAGTDRSDQVLYERALRLMSNGQLDEKSIRDAAIAGDRDMVIAALAVTSGFTSKAVRNVFDMRASKGIAAICWKSRLSMELAHCLQITVGSIAPNAVVAIGDNGGYSLSDKELNWQIEFFDT